MSENTRAADPAAEVAAAAAVGPGEVAAPAPEGGKAPAPEGGERRVPEGDRDIGDEDRDSAGDADDDDADGDDDFDPQPVAPGRRGGGRKGGRKGGRRGQQATPVAAPVVASVRVQPIASPARMKQRHWGLLLSFVLLVLLPLVTVVFYLWTYATDQYLSTTGFTVRSQESGGATELLGGLAQFTGGQIASDSDILYEFIQSQEMVAAVDAALDLRARYSRPWPQDWVFAIWPDATLEDLIWYWQRIIGISYDAGTGLIEVQAVAFDAQTAQAVNAEIVRVSQQRINALNERARDDAMSYARADLEETIVRLKAAREALTRFRTRTGIVDPEADIQGRLGVMNNLQQELASALIEFDLLNQTARQDDPRLTKAQQRIEVIRDRIGIERRTFASDSTETGGLGEDYPSLISEFESLTVDRQYAEESYRAALTALEVARADAVRQSRYLATYIRPTLAEDSEYPRRWILSGLAALFLILVWSILALVYYSIRDRS